MLWETRGCDNIFFDSDCTLEAIREIAKKNKQTNKQSLGPSLDPTTSKSLEVGLRYLYIVNISK